MKIGNVEIKEKAALAPMAGVTDIAFRELCRGYGAAYTVGEMVSCKGLCYGDRKSRELLKLSDDERPSAVQLFGDSPEFMARAALMAMEYEPQWIDINMGCPTPKIVNNGCGSALMKRPELCGEIVKAVKSAVDVPVTVKIRAGWDKDSINAVQVAQICESAGADAIAIHARTRAQMYAPSADWNIIAQVKQAVKIPVIGNGDVFTAHDAAHMMEQTNCDMVMVGRGALGNPWIFAQINAWLNEERLLPKPTVAQSMTVMLKHIKRMVELKGERGAMLEARKHAAWYIKGMRGAAVWRQKAGQLSTFDDAERLAYDVMTAYANEQSAGGTQIAQYE